MTDPDEIARFHDRCSDLMRELLDELADAPERPRTFPEIEDAIGWPRRRIASVLGGGAHLRRPGAGGAGARGRVAPAARGVGRPAAVPLPRRPPVSLRALGAVDGRRPGA